MRLQALKFPFRRAPKDAPPTFFFHIPKCAGTSVWETLFHIYGAPNVFIVNSKREREKLAAKPLEARLRYGAVGGHGPLSSFRELLGEMPSHHKIVTLRDPIDRALSEYNYVRGQAAHPRNADLAQQDLATFATETLVSNRQVKLLTGRDDDVGGAVETVTRFFDDWALSSGVGALTERLYETVGLEPRHAQHKNKGGSGLTRNDLDSEARHLLEEQNRHDLALIEALKSLRP